MPAFLSCSSWPAADSRDTWRCYLPASSAASSRSALHFFNVSNRHTFSLIFKHDMATPAAFAARRGNVIEMIVRYVRA